MKEFVDSICYELSNLLHLGSSLTDIAGISWMKLTELKPDGNDDAASLDEDNI